MITPKRSMNKIPRNKIVKFRRTDQSMMLLTKVIREYHEKSGDPLTKIELRTKRKQAAVAMEEAARDIRA